MLVKKINASIGLLITLLLLFHAVYMAVFLFANGGIAYSASFVSWALTGLTAIHAFIGIDAAISGMMNGGGLKHKKYAKLNITTVIQRASGMLLVIFIVLHIAGATGAMKPPPFVHAIVPVLFFGASMVHTVCSFPRALITLGIGNAKFVKTADIAMKVICGAVLIADIVGFYLYRV